MVKAGSLKQVVRGQYRLASMPEFTEPDLVAVALRSHQGVICLVSALFFHELTTQIPHEVYLAIPSGRKPPVLRYPPVRVFYYSSATFTKGVQVHDVQGVKVRIYSPERTLVDCFKFRNRIGVDVAVEAMKRYCRRRNSNMDAVLGFARLCRVEKVMAPYLETVLS
jgi:predicted transcriptional regulator of viral defense system